MDYKQKYKEALERAKGIYEQGMSTERLEYIFPELRESENERIRKAIFKSLSKKDARDVLLANGIQVSDALVWLKKQGEKFIPEDINEAALQYVDTCAVDGEITHDNITEPYWNHHSMIAAYKAGWLEKQCEQNPKDKYTFKSIPRLLDMIEPTDRAKSYCKNLIDSLQTEGYVTDAKIVSDCLKQMNGEKVAMATMDEQKPTWSEQHIADVFEKVGLARIVREQGNDQLTNAVQSAMIELSKQQKSWSEEDEQNLNFWLDNNKSIDSDKRNWLKSLKDRVQPQPKQEWSKEDERMILKLIKHFEWKDTGYRFTKENCLEATNWLKSLKPNHWKPSEQNIKDLEWCADLIKDKMGVGFHRLQVFINEIKQL